MRISVAALCLVLGGCMLLDARRQQASLEQTCRISGSVTSAGSEPRRIVVVLLRQSGGSRQVVDHFVLEQPGRWAFAAPQGSYAVAAFEDRNRDLLYQPGEAYGSAGLDPALACAAGARLAGVALAIPAQVKNAFPHTLDIAALQKRDTADQARRTLGQLTVAGEVVALSEARFSDQNAEDSLWRPLDFLVNGWAGVYFLEPYDARKIPVLFVHGINGSPANFAALVEHLDRTRYQPWVYYYPSGLRLEAIAEHLDQTMAKLQQRYGFARFGVVAHSMGGLVARGFIQRHAASARPARIPLFVTIATPWAGHQGAEIGVRTSPVVVPVWRDMAPGSEYQRGLYARALPSGMQHHLLFTYKDETVTLESQLLAEAQREAARLYGFGETHMGVLRNAAVTSLVGELLKQAFLVDG